jgi:hypothetical protein
MKSRIAIEYDRAILLFALVCLLLVPAVTAQTRSRDPVLENAPRPKTEDAGLPPPYTPTSRYEVRPIEGWTVLIDKGFLDREPDLADRTLTLLRQRLRQVAERIKAGPLEKLRSIHIWVEEQESHHPCMAYHPDAGWLREHGMNPDKARCVEVANACNFLKWTSDQPWMVLHELAHGYHHQFLEGGFNNVAVKAAYDQAIKAKLYESVARVHGPKQKAYAATNPMEYFAENSEAFFGKNDFYPFIRSDIQQFDPKMFWLLQTLWNVDSQNKHPKQDSPRINMDK